jgi:hypothetical protein
MPQVVMVIRVFVSLHWPIQPLGDERLQFMLHPAPIPMSYEAGRQPLADSIQFVDFSDQQQSAFAGDFTAAEVGHDLYACSGGQTRGRASYTLFETGACLQTA